VELRDFVAKGVLVLVEYSADPKALRRLRSVDERDDCVVAVERPTSPIQRDERKEPMLDFVPLAGARRKMAHVDGEPEFVCEPLQLLFLHA
jgi:hypothetical protein